MDCLSNEADPMPPSGHPIREIRPTPWWPSRERGQSAKTDIVRDPISPSLISCIYHDRAKDFARGRAFTTIKYFYLHGL